MALVGARPGQILLNKGLPGHAGSRQAIPAGIVLSIQLVSYFAGGG